jgi:hypothetical protein
VREARRAGMCAKKKPWGVGSRPLMIAALLFVCAAGGRPQQHQSLEAGREFTRM